MQPSLFDTIYLMLHIMISCQLSFMLCSLSRYIVTSTSKQMQCADKIEQWKESITRGTYLLKGHVQVGVDKHKLMQYRITLMT